MGDPGKPKTLKDKLIIAAILVVVSPFLLIGKIIDLCKK